MGKKLVLTNSALYVFCNILLKAFSFFLLPLYTAYLNTQDYGITGLVGSFTSVAGFVFSFSLYSAVVKFYTAYSDDRAKVKRLFSTLFFFVLLSGIGFTVLFVFIREPLGTLFFKGVDFFPTIFIALVGLVFNNVYTLYVSILQTLQKGKMSSILSVSFFFFQLLLNILFVVFLRMGANGVLLSALISYFSFVCYAALSLYKKGFLRFCIDGSILKECLKYSIPLIPHNLSVTVAQLVSKIFINGSYSLSSVGLFNIACQFGGIADVIQGSVNSALTPWLYGRLKRYSGGNDEQIVSMTNCLMIVYGFCFLLLSFFSQEAVLIMTEESFHRAWMVVPLIVGAYVIKTTYYFYIGVMFYYNALSRRLFWATCSASLLNIFLSAIFIPKWDMYGSALADIFAMLFRVVIVFILAKNKTGFGYKISVFVSFTLFTLIFIGVGILPSYLFFPYKLSFINITLKFVCIVVYTTILCVYFRRDVSPILAKTRNVLKGRVNGKFFVL